MLSACLGVLFALQQGEEPRLQRVEAEVLILESPTRPEVAETDRGPAAIVAVSGTVFILDLPRGASSVEIRSSGGQKRKLDVATIPVVAYDKPCPFRAETRLDSIEIDNTGGSSRIIVVAIGGTERRVAGEIVEAGAKRTIELVPGSRAFVVDPAAGTGIRCVALEPSSGFRFNTGPFHFRGLTPRLTGMIGSDLSIHVSDRSYSGVDRSQPLTKSIQVDLSFDEKSFEAVGFGVAADFDLIVLEAEIFFGNWRGSARMNNGATDIDGTLLGVKLDAYWPMVVYRSDSWEFGAGPEVGFLWIQEKIEEVKNAPFAVEDTLRETAFTVGPTVGAGVALGPGRLSMRASAMFLWGDLGGMGGELSVGYTVRF